jgi:Tfp pilus assembly protein PilF
MTMTTLRHQRTAAGMALALLVFGAAPGVWAEDYFTTHLDPVRLRYRETVEAFHVDKVPDLIRQGRLKDAAHELTYTLDRFPNHPRALILLEVLGPLVNNPALAVTYYQRALEAHPEYAVIRVQYGLHLIDVGVVDSAIEQIRRAIAQDETLGVAHAALARAYAKKGQMDLARQAAERAIALGHDVPDVGGGRSPSAEPSGAAVERETKGR